MRRETFRGVVQGFSSPAAELPALPKGRLLLFSWVLHNGESFRHATPRRYLRTRRDSLSSLRFQLIQRESSETVGHFTQSDMFGVLQTLFVLQARGHRLTVIKETTNELS